MNCTCGAAYAGLPPDQHARDCRIRTAFIPNDDPSHAERAERQRARHRRERWQGIRGRMARVGFVRGTLDALGLGCLALCAAMLHPIAGVGVLGVAILAYSWRLDDDDR